MLLVSWMLSRFVLRKLSIHRVLPDHAIGVGAAGFATVHPEAGSAVYGVLTKKQAPEAAAADLQKELARVKGQGWEA